MTESLSIFEQSSTILSVGLFLFFILSIKGWYDEKKSQLLKDWGILACFVLFQYLLFVLVYRSLEPTTSVLFLIICTHALRCFYYARAIVIYFSLKKLFIKKANYIFIAISLGCFLLFLYGFFWAKQQGNELKLFAFISFKILCILVMSLQIYTLIKARKKIKNKKELSAAIFLSFCISFYLVVTSLQPSDLIIFNYCFIAELMIFALSKQSQSIAKTNKIRQDLWEAKQLAQQWYILGNIAHDIRSPLSLSIDHFDRLANEIKHHGKPNESIETIIDHGKKALLRINKIIHEYLSMLEDDDSSYEIINLNLVVQEALILCETKINLFENIEIKQNVAKDIEFKAQENQMVMMFVNLINNALDALQKNKTPFIEINANLTRNLLTIKIIDNGIGIPQENQDLIFKKGFSTKAEGTGLGLDFIKLVAKNHHGRIFVEEKNLNTCFVVELNLFQ